VDPDVEGVLAWRDATQLALMPSKERKPKASKVSGKCSTRSHFDRGAQPSLAVQHTATSSASTLAVQCDEAQEDSDKWSCAYHCGDDTTTADPRAQLMHPGISKSAAPFIAWGRNSLARMTAALPYKPVSASSAADRLFVFRRLPLIGKFTTTHPLVMLIGGAIGERPL
jgi:hypothetical protein